MDKTVNRTRGTDTDDGVNVVRLVGRLTALPESRELPSGDELVTFRLSVVRAPVTGKGAALRPPGTDSVPCVAWSTRIRRSAGTWRVGDVVEVAGAVRCRFFQAGGATRSRVEVEVTSARVTRRSRAS